ncbi:EVE domain-containing protein [Candidatus Cyanaurora vandensis]|uniref:EVE domain-containing protein n=1 Tax=Candidatus Cyanaurora vandensis TaxID=2714958 RepID=UPI00257A3205|nr:EVE domain-containing protein [Candidatus Cyanaurora vandensis]
MKSEPGSYSIDDLARDGRTHWEGVRNYQARNLMRDQMQAGDAVLFYHSNAQPPGVAGLARISQAAQPDPTAQDPNHAYYDPKAIPQNPWLMVELGFVAKFPCLVSLRELKDHPGLTGLMVIQRGARLSVQPVAPEHFRLIEQLGLGD